jgi:hypothetical protein
MHKLRTFLHEITSTTRGVLNFAAGLPVGGAGCFYVAALAFGRELSGLIWGLCFFSLAVLHGILCFLLTRHYSGMTTSTAPLAFGLGFDLPLILLIGLFSSNPKTRYVGVLMGVATLVLVNSVSCLLALFEARRRSHHKNRGFEVQTLDKREHGKSSEETG